MEINKIKKQANSVTMGKKDMEKTDEDTESINYTEKHNR
jgi:hypothetical protein